MVLFDLCCDKKIYYILKQFNKKYFNIIQFQSINITNTNLINCGISS